MDRGIPTGAVPAERRAPATSRCNIRWELQRSPLASGLPGVANGLTADALSSIWRLVTPVVTSRSAATRNSDRCYDIIVVQSESDYNKLLTCSDMQPCALCQTPPTDLLTGVSRLLRPLVWLLLCSGITFPMLTDALRRLLVDVATTDI